MLFTVVSAAECRGMHAIRLGHVPGSGRYFLILFSVVGDVHSFR